MNDFFTQYFRTCIITLFCIILISIFHENTSITKQSNKKVWILYFAHFGNLETNGKWVNWRMKKGEWIDHYFEPPLSIPSNYFPSLGLYSSQHKSTIKKHLKMISDCNIDAIIVPWDGPNRKQTQEMDKSFIDDSLKIIMELAPDFSIKVGVLLTNYIDRNNETEIEDIKYYLEQYNEASLKINDKPVIITGCSIEQEVIDKYCSSVYFVGFGKDLNDALTSYDNGYDGFTSYSLNNENTFLNDLQKWEYISNVLYDHGMNFIPSISPGLNESAFNIQLIYRAKSREGGKFYNNQWKQAFKTEADFILINSFNNWFDGTVIEPVSNTKNFPLNNDIWAGDNPNIFLDITKEWVDKFHDI